MANSTSALVAALKTVISSTIGVGATELAFLTDLSKNKLGGDRKGYGVLASTPEQVEGVNSFITYDQRFSIVLTEGFAPSGTGDQLKRVAAETLCDRLEAIYKQVINTKAGSPAIVIRTFGLLGSDVEYIENIAAIRASFTIKYRSAL